MRRHKVTNKRRGARKFNHQAKRTKGRNLFRTVMRGGYRL